VASVAASQPEVMSLGVQRVGRSVPASAPAVLLLLAAGAWLAFAQPPISALWGGALVGACLVVAYRAGRGASIAMRVYVLYTVVWFLLAPVTGELFPSMSSGLSSPQLGAVWVTVSVWLLGWSAGMLLLRPRVRTARVPRTGLSYRDASLGLITVGVVALLLEILQAAHGVSSYATQIAGGASTGVTGTIASLAAPALTAGFVFAWPTATRRGRILLALLILAQAGVSSLNSFRGTAIEFLIGAGVAYLVIHPQRLRHRTRTVAAALALIVLVGIPLTLLANAQRQAVAAASGYGKVSPLSLATLPRVAVQRFDETPALAAALAATGPAAKQAVRMDHQVEDFVPRVLWPGKPIFNYGEQVSVAVYDIPPSIHTASTITWLGDLYLNGGLMAVLIAGVVLATISRVIFERAVEGRVLIALGAVLLLGVLFNPESPLVLDIAGGLRSLLLLGAACFAGAAIRKVLGRAERVDRPAQPAGQWVYPHSGAVAAGVSLPPAIRFPGPGRSPL
jgi:hypothetical protein